MKYFRDYKIAIFTAVLFFLMYSCQNQKQEKEFYYPADFEPAETTYFIWVEQFEGILAELIGVITQKDKVKLFMTEEDDLASVREMLSNYNSNFENIHFERLTKKPPVVWVRDYGPAFLINGLGDKKVVNFNYFGKQITFNSQIADIMNLPLIQVNLNSTGGAREVNGEGAILLCETHELDVNKNKTRQEIEIILKDKLNLKNVIWLKQGIPQDDNPLNGPLVDNIYPNGVNGHVDEFCRFANTNTILISSVSESEAQRHPILNEAKKRLDTNYEILKKASIENGNKFNIIRVPMAPLLIVDWSQGENKRLMTSVTSYMNFIVTNSYVILPSYISSSQELKNESYIRNEKKVVEIFKEVFPSREIVRVEATQLNHYSGGFHCLSINEPAVK